MKNNPLISVIVPCYNDGRYINECIESVHNQSYENYEIIIINDGSNDLKTNKILRAISHPKITVFETKNQGVSLARNFGIEKSKGIYILPLDADDKIGLNFIGQAIKILESRPTVKVVGCDVMLFGDKNGILQFEPYSIEKLICKNIIVVSSVYRRSDFNNIGGYNPNMKDGFEDWDFWLSFLKNGGDVYKIDSVEFYYRIKKDSRNNLLNKEKFKKLRRQIYENHKDLYAQHFLDPQNCFEYELIIKSKEYCLGKFLLKPIRFLNKLLY